MLEWEHAHGIDFLPPTMHLLRSSDPTKFNKCFRAQLVPARGPSAINVLGNSHSFLFTNCTAGSNPEMFPPQLREPVKHMPDAFPTGFWMHGLWFPKPRWWKKSLPGFGTSTHWFYERMSRMRSRGRERWTGWLEPGSGAPRAGQAPLPASLSNSSTICLVHLTQLCSKLTLQWIHLQLCFLVPCLCLQVLVS